MSLQDHVPPQSLEAEMAVLGAVMVDREMLDTVVSILRPSDFYSPHHQDIFRAYVALAKQRAPIDKITIAEHLRRSGEYDAIGGIAYLGQLMDVVPTSASTEYYAQIVRDKATLRELIDAGRRIYELAFASEHDVDGALDQSEKFVRAILERHAPMGGGITSRALFEQVFAEIARRADGEVEVGFSSPWPGLDLRIGRFQPSELVIWPAAPGTGKSALLLCLADYTAYHYGTVAFFSLEMTPRAMGMRHVALYADISTRKMRLGNTSATDWDRIGDAGFSIVTRPLVWYDRKYARLIDIRRELARLSKRERVVSFVIDHATFVAEADTRGNDKSTMNERLERVYRRVLDIAHEFNCVAHVVAHFNRDAMKQRPTLTGIRDGGNPEGNAHIIIAPYRPTPDAPEARDRAAGELVILKAREGEAGSVPMEFHGWRSLWLEVDQHVGVRAPWWEAESETPLLAAVR